MYDLFLFFFLDVVYLLPSHKAHENGVPAFEKCGRYLIATVKVVQIKLIISKPKIQTAM